jgi:hypothetical protein
MAYKTPYAGRTPATPAPAQKYELLYATVLSHWRRSHCETSLLQRELCSIEAQPASTALRRALVLWSAALQRRALHRWTLAASELAAGHAVQAAAASLRRERAQVKETAARLVAAEEAELAAREQLEAAKADNNASVQAERADNQPRQMGIRAKQLVAAWREAQEAPSSAPPVGPSRPFGHRSLSL